MLLAGSPARTRFFPLLKSPAAFTLLPLLLLPVQAGAQPDFRIFTTTGDAVNQVNFGSPVILIATFDPGHGLPTLPSGTVVFCDGAVAHCLDGHAIGASQVAPPPENYPYFGTSARLTILPTAGMHTYYAVYLDAGPLEPGTSEGATLNVLTPPLPGATSTALTATGTPGNYTLNANVLGAGAGYTEPTGTVGFFDFSNAGTPLGTAPVGPATFSFGFGPPLNSGFLTIGPSASTVADVNNDGIPDLIVVAPDMFQSVEDIYVMLGNGGGRFQNSLSLYTQTTIDVVSAPFAIAAGDFNNDDNVDLAISAGYHVYYFEGSGAGLFSQVSTQALPPQGVVSFASTAVADLGHSGFQSIVGIGPGGLVALTNNSSSGSNFSFTVGQPQGNIGVVATGSQGALIALGDINGDGNTDAVVADYQTNSFTVYLGNGQGTFTQGSTFGVGTSPSAIVLADFNGDGKLDVAVANRGDNTVSVLTGTGDGANFTPVSTMSVVPLPQFLVTGDFNGDGVTDFAAGGGDAIAVELGRGDGAFTDSTLTADVTWGLLAADLNSDGFTDIVAISSENQPAAIIAQPTASTSATLTGVDIVGSGAHQVVAYYAGDTNFQGSVSGKVSLTAVPLVTTLQLVAQPSPSQAGQQVTLTATLSPYTAQSDSTDSERIVFYDGATRLGTARLALGVAGFVTTSLSVGSHNLRAVYAGDTDFAPATSPVVSFTVE